MRFSYIDSQGKEIEVDSVESLALRIELGAIEPDTRMYDAVADRWAPAEEHPVFRSLSRGEEVSEDDVVHIGQEEAEVEAAEAPAGSLDAEGEEDGLGEDDADERDEEPGADEAAPTDGEPGDGDATAEEAETPAPDEADDGLGLDFSVTLSDDEEDESPAGREGSEVGAAREAEGGGEAEEDDSLPGLEGEPAATDPGTDVDEGDDEDVFGEMEPLELEEEPAADRSSGPDAATGPETGAPVELDGEAEEETADADTAGGAEELAGPEEAASAGSGDEDLPPWAAGEESVWGDESGSDEEQDASAAAETSGRDSSSRGQKDEPLPDPVEHMPEWAAREEGEEDQAPAPEVAEEPRREKPEAPRPTHWEERKKARKRRRILVRVAMIAVAVLAVGGGAVYFLGIGGSGGEAPEQPPRPTVSPELRSTLTAVSSGAFDDVLGAFRRDLDGRELPDRPPETWLEGRYLSAAGDFPAVPEYWEAIRGAVSELDAEEGPAFRERLEARLEERTDAAEEGLSPAQAARIREVALFEYRASEPGRDSVYAGLLDVARASLDLHALLVERQADIAYEPFEDPNVSRDPVLEAVPTDSILRVEMNDRLDRVLDAIADAELPRPITTPGLMDHLLYGLAEVGVLAPDAVRAGAAGDTTPEP